MRDPGSESDDPTRRPIAVIRRCPRVAHLGSRTAAPDPAVKILLIRLRLIGDVVFTTPLIRALKRTFPDAHLTYLVEPAGAAGRRGKPHLDEVIVAPTPAGLARIADDLRLAGRLRRERYDIAIDLHGGPRSAWLAWLSRAPMRIGYEIAGRTWMYTRAVPRPRTLRRRHSVVQPVGPARRDRRVACRRSIPDRTRSRCRSTLPADSAG